MKLEKIIGVPVTILGESVFKISALTFLVHYATEEFPLTHSGIYHLSRMGACILSYSMGEAFHYLRDKI